MADLSTDFKRDGVVVFESDARVAEWARAALLVARDLSQNPALRAKWLRNANTWFVGVDVLTNDPDGSIGGVPLAGPWEGLVRPPLTWHKAQVSVVYPGYPQQDAGDSTAAHRFRIDRSAAHVDGLRLEAGRRIVREPHAFILGMPLNDSNACPLVVWQGSHVPMRAALLEIIGQGDPCGADVTEAYKAARAAVFRDCPRIEVDVRPGQAVLLNRFAVHGVAPWCDGMRCPDEGRMMAYFRPEFETSRDWLRVGQ